MKWGLAHGGERGWLMSGRKSSRILVMMAMVAIASWPSPVLTIGDLDLSWADLRDWAIEARKSHQATIVTCRWSKTPTCHEGPC